MSAEELQRLLSGGNTSIQNKLMYFGSSLRGSLQWKKTRRSELLDLIDEKGLPTFFITLSAADLHWPDLQSMMMRHELASTDIDIIDDAGRNGRVVRNPHFVAAFFVQRCQFFLTTVVNSEGKMKDYWLIFEWQHRGSIHAHGLLWMSDCPKDVEKLLEGGDEEKHALLQYYDSYISAWNPGSISAESISHYKEHTPDHPQLANPTIIVPTANKHPCQIRFGESDDPENDLSQLINSTNRHRNCSVTTCLKKKTRKACLQSWISAGFVTRV